MADQLRYTSGSVKQSMDNAQQEAAEGGLGKIKEYLEQGAYDASERDIRGVRNVDPTGFSTSGAKFDETFGGNALTETGFKEPRRGLSREGKIEKEKASEDALRQMS